MAGTSSSGGIVVLIFKMKLTFDREVVFDNAVMCLSTLTYNLKLISGLAKQIKECFFTLGI